MRLLLTTLALMSFCGLFGQIKKPPKPTPATERLKNETIREDLRNKSFTNGIKFRNVGPTVMSGRVTDIDVNPSDPTHFYVAYASGGLWVTKNNGTSFEPVMDDLTTITIGDICVDWKSGVIWVGTGENNSSRSSYSGIGIYSSSDWGESWEYKGLPESHHIGRIIVHPDEGNTIWVAALGHLYGPNEERGVYKSVDGGKTWNKTLFVNDNAGAIDLVINDNNPNQLFAAVWERTRRAWDFTESGSGSGIYESQDGGSSWSLLTGDGSGFPQGEGVGRIGLALNSAERELALYAILDNQDRREKEDDDEDKALVKGDFNGMSKEDFREIPNSDLQTFLEDNNFPEKYDSTEVKRLVDEGEITPMALYDYLYDANVNLFDTPVIGAEVYKLNIADKSWSRTHEDYLDDLVYSYGYYFGLIRVHPKNPNQLYIAGVPILESGDGGKTWSGINADNVHVDHHALWINPDREGHIINGNDGGINISYDNGETYIKCNSPSVGQFYTVNVDQSTPYNVYGGLQDNGVWKGPSTYEAGDGWHQSGNYPYEMLMGGDGMQVEIDNRDNETVYTGYQFGHYMRINNETGDRHYFHPQHELGEKPLRWNWQTPIHQSIHNQDIIYMGSNKFHRSMDKAETWKTMGDDLTNGGIAGDVPFGSLTSISESPDRFGLIYVGSDDGLVHVTTDGGESWTKVSDKLPQNLWVSRVIASSHSEGRVYCTLNGYRWDDFKPYAYVSEDYGKTWTQIGTDLPSEPINVVKEDPENEDILYLGTDNGLYVSLDRGKSFMTMSNDIPAVAVHDMVFHEREKDLVIGTHGRSIYIGDMAVLHEYNPGYDVQIFSIEPLTYGHWWGNSSWSKWLGFMEPDLEIPVFARSGSDLTVIIEHDSIGVIKTWEADSLHKGFNFLPYDLTIGEEAFRKLKELAGEDELKEEDFEPSDNSEFYLLPGSYKLTIECAEGKAEGEILIEE